MLPIPFLDAGLTKQNDLLVKQRANRDDFYWFPVIMGVVSRQEVDVATVADLQLYNELAEQKYQMMNAGGDQFG